MTEEETRGKIFLFTGEENFLIREKLRNWKKASEEKHGEFNILNIEIDIPQKDSDNYLNLRSKEISSELVTPSFFGEKRVIFLDNFPITEIGKKSAKDTEKYSLRIVRALENLPEANVVILSSANPDKRTKVWKMVNKIAKVELFDKLQERELIDLIIARIEHLGGKILPAAAQFLISYIGNDLWKIDREISKLVHFCEAKPIAESDIQKICIPSVEIINFGISNALQDGNLKKVFEIFHNEIDSGTAPQAIILRDLAPVMRQILHVAWANENNKNANEAGMNPWMFNRWKNAVKKISFDEAKQAYNALMLIDEGSKTGKIEVKSDDVKMFSLVIEAFFLEFFGGELVKIRKPLLKKEAE